VAETRYAIEPGNIDIFRDFLEEAPQLLGVMEESLLQDRPGAASDEAADAVMRSLHTLKGIFGFMSMGAMNALCHEAEGAIEARRKIQAELPAELRQWLLDAVDAIRGQVDEIGKGLPGAAFTLLDLSSLQGRSAGMPGPGQAPAPKNPQQAAESGQEHFIRIRVGKMDSLLELVGEMAICQSQVSEGLGGQALPPALASELARLDKISRELQQSVLSLRLVPVEPLMLRASRIAHDVALKTGKDIAFSSEGRETELDKRMVEELAEPLLHLIRNAVDHGLEPASQRLAAGKPAQGSLRLKASHQSGEFLLEIEDDGRGLDLQQLASRGQAMGLLQPGEDADEARVTRLIFAPGFSTAASVTDISGRGVGLDAVHSKISSLKGEIRVSSRMGQGCRFSIRLPLTMALVEGILVRVGDERYVVPASHVRKFVALESASSHHMGTRRGWLESEGESLPLIDLGPLGRPPAPGKPRQVALHLRGRSGKAVLVVDEVLGRQQVVAKSLGVQLKAMPGISGGAILGDGRVSLILDLEALMGRDRIAA
jgi:two-component system chemotaxis sensor kinase CheA